MERPCTGLIRPWPAANGSCHTPALPAAQITIDRLPRRKIVGQEPPRHSGPRVDQFPRQSLAARDAKWGHAVSGRELYTAVKAISATGNQYGDLLLGGVGTSRGLGASGVSSVRGEANPAAIWTISAKGNHPRRSSAGRVGHGVDPVASLRKLRQVKPTLPLPRPQSLLHPAMNNAWCISSTFTPSVALFRQATKSC